MHIVNKKEADQMKIVHKSIYHYKVFLHSHLFIIYNLCIVISCYCIVIYWQSWQKNT